MVNYSNNNDNNSDINNTHNTDNSNGTILSGTQPKVYVDSSNVTYTEDSILSNFIYHNNKVAKDESSNRLVVTPFQTLYSFKTCTSLPRLGLLVVGFSGNNGSTLLASLLANKLNLKWNTKKGMKTPNYYGSTIMSSTMKLGTFTDTNTNTVNNQECYASLFDVLPMVHPNSFVVHGWDINNSNLFEAMKRAQVIDYDLQQQLKPIMEKITPMKSIYDETFIASNQKDRANNILSTNKTKHELMQIIMQDITNFKKTNNLDKVIVVWSASTERYSKEIEGINDTSDNLLQAIKNNEKEISPSTLFAVACILLDVPFINGSPQNTFVKGAIELASKQNSFIAGDDFKSGQTKLKSVLVDFLVNTGIKPVAITSYNHLGNNDGLNLASEEQFKSKEITKSNVIDDMISSNHILYSNTKTNENKAKVDHTVVIKYVESVGDTKRALDEYISEIFMGGQNTMAIYNLCEDSLLAAPLIVDLVILTELITRIKFKTSEMSDYKSFNSVLSILGYMLKAPVVPPDTPLVNSLHKQRLAITNLLRALIGLQPESDMMLEYKAF